MIRIELPHAQVVFTTRTGGSSDGDFESLNLGRFTADTADAIDENLRLVREQLGLSGIQLLHQVHGGDHIEASLATLSEMPEADAAFTESHEVALLATGADCPPVALTSADRVAIVHCGWKPVAAGVIEAVGRKFVGTEFQAIIGPGICQDHFEVGPEVVEALGADEHADGRQLDLRAVVQHRLEQLGAASVVDVGRCTYCEPDAFFSHRRDGAATGRQAGIVWRT